MSVYEVYATRWNDGHIAERIPATDLEFTLPLSDHGTCSLTARVEPGRSWWRQALSSAMSGIVVMRDEQPVWDGMMVGESQNGQRSFQFTFVEWGAFFAQVPAVAHTYVDTDDHAIFRDLISRVQLDPQTDPGILLPTTTGDSKSDLIINEWDSVTVEEQFVRLGESVSGPEWYFAATGTLDNPTRTLILGDRLGSTTPEHLLEYVEDTETYVTAGEPPVGAFDPTFPRQQPYALVGGRRGGNVISHPARRQSLGYSAVLAVGGGETFGQIRSTALASTLLTNGYPRRTLTQQYNDVVSTSTLARHAAADLAATAGMTTSYTLSTFGTDPDWVQVNRGDSIRIELDTDVYAGEQPWVFNSRVREIAVSVPDDGDEQVNYTVADVQEV